MHFIKALAKTSTLLLVLSAGSLSAQQKFSPASLKEDVEFIQKQIFDAQANPFTELTREQYAKVFAGMEANITDSLTIQQFYKLVKPAVAWLSDEHAGISLPKNVSVFDATDLLLPISIVKKGNAYIVDSVLAQNTPLKKGDAVKAIDGNNIETLVNNCANYVTGFPSQRIDKATMYFGYLYGLANAVKYAYNITLQNGKTVTVSGINPGIWNTYITNTQGMASDCGQMVSYAKHGTTGYINACSFSTSSDSEFYAVAHVIDSIFAQIRHDNIQKLFIDVSKNGGGNSSVGDVIIANFYGKPYRTYQCNWRRSDEYLAAMAKWGLKDEAYQALKPGEVQHYNSDTLRPGGNPNRFAGKVYVVVGDGTFSSAMMFATIIKDNHIAQLVGNAPRNGHPTHFGEMYSAQAPNTHIAVRFGVKEWIRPAGKEEGNVLQPDIAVKLNGPLSAESLELMVAGKL